MPWFVCATSSSNPDYNGDGDYALVYIGHRATTNTPYNLLRFIGDVARLKHSIGALYKLVLWDSSVRYFSSFFVDAEGGGSDLPEELVAADDEITEVSEEFAKSCVDHQISVEADTLHVTHEKVFWTAHVKHSDVVLTTSTRFTKELLLGLEKRER